ncbi:T9SS type A sorting domain-containing protein [bacterium]|nr:T9SS type A sorting domain-containing protein [bacterium]
MKHPIVIIAALAFAGALFAQPEMLWMNAYGGGGGDQGLAIIQAENGNIVVVGNEGSFGGGGADGWLLILDDDGEEVLSAVDFGGAGYDRFCDVIEVEGGFVTGGYGGSFGIGQYDFWIAKIDEEGNQDWFRAFGGQAHERGYEIIQLADGGFALVGHTDSFGNGQGDGWIVATDEEGQEDWSAPFGGNGEDGFSGIAHGEEGSVVVSGKTNSFGEGGYDFWLIKIDANGDEVWSETYGDDGDNVCQRVERTDDGGYILVGSTVNDDAGDLWMVKTDEDGEEQWNRSFDQGGNELCRSVTQTVDGGYLLVGSTWPYDDARCDVWLVRTDDEGEELWSETYGGNQSDVGTDAVQMDDGGYAISGWTSSFGGGGLDYFVIRLGPEPAGVLSGFVLDLVEDVPLEGAIVITTNGLSAETDEEGFFLINPAWAGEFDMTASLPGYNDQTQENLEMGEEGELEVIFRLTHPEIEPSVPRFDDELGSDEISEFEFSVLNRGNGPLNYRIDRRLLGDHNCDPWELRRSYDIEEAMNDDMINGVIFAEDNYYVSGGNSGGSPSKIYIFDAEGEYVDEFDQVQESRYGIRDLAWDGNLIWGADVNDEENEVLFGYNLEGEHVATIDGDAASYRSLTWDPEHSCFWSANITSAIWATDLEGNVTATINRPGDVRFYGLAYWNDDPDGYNLYTFSRGLETDIAVYKINTDNGEAMLVTEFDANESRPGGIYITNELDIYSWVFMGIVQTPDRLAIWNLDARREWFQVEPDAGTIEAENEENFTLTLNSTGLPVNNMFEGEIVFVHNAIQGETALPVTLNVVEGAVFTHRELSLNMGWNTVSVNLQPEDYDSIRGLMSTLVEENLLIMMKNGYGDFYIPEYDFSNIDGWFVDQGYQLKMRDEGILRLEGISVLSDTPIDLEEGWQLVSYYPRRPIEATVALSGIEDVLIIAKDGQGHFYIPDWDFCNIGEMDEGQGYYMNVESGVQLVYRREREDEEAAGSIYSRMQSDPVFLPVHPVTGNNMSLLILGTPPLTPPLLCRGGIAGNNPPLRSRGGTKGGVEIGVYADGELVGSGVLEDGVCGIAVWGDDPTTDEIDGAIEGQELELVLVDEDGLHSVNYEILSGDSFYQTDGFRAVRLTGAQELPSEFRIISAYPNPFNSSIKITYSLPEASRVKLRLFDLTGREVMTLVNDLKQPGVHSTTLTANDLASGLYFVSLEGAGEVATRKVMLIR